MVESIVQLEVVMGGIVKFVRSVIQID